MKDDNQNWFSNWNEELPSPEELIPLSQTLISPHLALAFEIGIPNHHLTNKTSSIYHQRLQSTTQSPKSTDFAVDSSDLGTGGEEQARTLKRPRLVWTPQLHKRFVDAVAHLGIKNAVPKTIMLLMSVDGLTRENVASHLQKYRLYLRRMQGFSGNGNGVVSDSATDRLFASSPVPAHFLSPSSTVNSEHFMPEFHHQQQYRQAKFIGAPPPPPLPQQQSKVEHPYVGRFTETHQVVRSLRYEDSKSVNGDNAREILTLFPTGN